MFSPNFQVASEIICAAVFPEDIFIQTGDTPKVVFRKLRKVSHEDFAPVDQKALARDIFHKLQDAWSLTEELLASSSFGNKTRRIASFSQVSSTYQASFFVKSKKGLYSNLILHKEGKVANVYFGETGVGKKVVVKVANNPLCNQFLENESSHIQMMKDTFPQSESGRYFPTLLDSFSVSHNGDRVAVNVFEYLEGYYTLSDVIKMFSDAKISIDMRSGAWMYNRILETLSHSGPLKVVHGGVHPENILLHPESHRIVLTGWSSSVAIGAKVPYAGSSYTFMYPEEVVGDKMKRQANLSTDLYLAACTIWYALGGDVVKKTLPSNIPGEVRAFLDARLTSDIRLRDSVAIQQRDRFSGVLKGLYGPAKFHPFVLPISRR